VCIATTSPWSPTQRCQPSAEAASIERARARPGGSTLSRVGVLALEGVDAGHRDHAHGEVVERVCDFEAGCTSEPVPHQDQSGSASGVAAASRRRARSRQRGRVGVEVCRFWRERRSTSPVPDRTSQASRSREAAARRTSNVRRRRVHETCSMQLDRQRPTCFALSRQNLQPSTPDTVPADAIGRGAYVLRDPEPSPT